MGYKTLELNEISAKDLKNVSLIGKTDVYIVVSISDYPKLKTPVHQNGGTNPSWSYSMRLNVDEASAGRRFLVLQLKHKRTLLADKDLGQVRVPLSELLGVVNGKDGSSSQFVAYQVTRPSGKTGGELRFSIMFIETPEPSAPPSAVGSYPYPPPTGYASSAGEYPPQYAPAAAGYVGPGGYPPPPQQQGGYPSYEGGGYEGAQAKESNSGMGSGAGLVGAFAAGFVFGEVMDDLFDGGFDF